MQYTKDLEDESFDAVSFIERIATECNKENRIAGRNDDDKRKFDVVNLEIQFTNCMNNMKLLHASQLKKCQLLKNDYAKSRETFAQNVTRLQTRFNNCQDQLRDLDNKVNNVAMKIMHLGGQLESVNIPRIRSIEAYKLTSYFSDFLSDNNNNDDNNNSSSSNNNDYIDIETIRDDINKMNETADIVRKLFLISQELPCDDDRNKFERVKRKINAKYDQIERVLIEEFVKSQRTKSYEKMNDIAAVLSHFKGYSQCIDAFIEQSQADVLPMNRNIFENVVPLCEENFAVIAKVFRNNPEQVNAKFVLNIYRLKLHNYVGTVLSSYDNSNNNNNNNNSNNTEKYLENLTELYVKLTNLTNALKNYDNLGSDRADYLDVLSRNIFRKYLNDTYVTIESKHLKDKYADLLRTYYDKLGHQKKQQQYYASSFQGFRREIQAAIGTRTTFNIAQIEDYGGEIFLSDEVTEAILNKSKETFKRLTLFDSFFKNNNNNNSNSTNVVQLFDLVCNCLIGDYLTYAVNLGVNSIPLPELKGRQPPDVYFFDIVAKANDIADALQKHFDDDVLPLINDYHLQDCLAKKDASLSDIEEKLDAGIDSTLNTIVGWMKIYLQTEQKKTDFKPDVSDRIDIAPSSVCRTIVQYTRKIIDTIKNRLDGKNRQNVSIELGVRFHRTIYEHLLQYTYNESGALCAICDVNEYKKCIRDFLNYPLINTLFDTLHALCNLLLVKPENLETVCGEQILAVLDNNVLLSFIQLRSDIKSLKLSVNLKGI